MFFFGVSRKFVCILSTREQTWNLHRCRDVEHSVCCQSSEPKLYLCRSVLKLMSSVWLFPEQEVKWEKVHFDIICHLFAQLRNYFPNQSRQTFHMTGVKGYGFLSFLLLVMFSVPVGILFSSKRMQLGHDVHRTYEVL